MFEWLKGWHLRVNRNFSRLSPMSKLIYFVLFYGFSIFVGWFVRYLANSPVPTADTGIEIVASNLLIIFVLFLFAYLIYGYKIWFWLVLSIISMVALNWFTYNHLLLDNNYNPIVASAGPVQDFLVRLFSRIYLSVFLYGENLINAQWKLVVVNSIYYFALAPIIHYIFTYNKRTDDYNSMIDSLKERVKRLNRD